MTEIKLIVNKQGTELHLMSLECDIPCKIEPSERWGLVETEAYTDSIPISTNPIINYSWNIRPPEV